MIERRYIFFPERPFLETPEQWGLQYEEARFPASLEDVFMELVGDGEATG